jgi:Diguanylate cyclase, GGDEF domain
MSIEMAVADALTALHDRRCMEMHLATPVEQPAARGKPLSVRVLDIDYFKVVNDGPRRRRSAARARHQGGETRRPQSCRDGCRVGAPSRRRRSINPICLG